MSVETIGAVTASSAMTTITPPGANNTKGAWTELVASSSFAANGIIVLSELFNNGDYLIDIGTGAAASETAIIQNFPGCLQNASNNGQFVSVASFPIAIASGTRVSARYQSTTASNALIVGAFLIAKDTVGFSDCTSSVTYGAATGSSGGTSVDPGGSANTKGSYSAITASTSADHQWFYIGIGSRNNAAIDSNSNWLVDIATGGAGSESVVIANIPVRAPVTSDWKTPQLVGPFPLAISSGTRIAARAQCSNIDATDRLIDVILIAFSGSAPAGGGGGPTFAAFIG